MSYKVTEATDTEFIDKLFYSNHTGEGHEVTEQPTYICDEEE